MKRNIGILLAILAAIFYSINSPLSKILLDYMPSTLMAGFLYLGAGICMLFIFFFRKIIKKEKKELKLTKCELPYTIMMIILDILAPIFLLLGLKSISASNASLLNNFEIVSTALIAFIIFKEKISLRLWVGIIFVTFSCFLLSIESLDNFNNFNFSIGSIFVLIACICWGVENNCTKMLSSKDPLQIVLLKGIFSGCGSLIIGFIIGERLNNLWSVFAVLGVGVVAYGLSIFVYVYAQRLIGAARTSAYYAISPFIGSFLSFLIFHQLPNYFYLIALLLMMIGAWLCIDDKPLFKKSNQI